MEQSSTLQRLSESVDSDHLITDDVQKAYYCKGFATVPIEALTVLPQTTLAQFLALSAEKLPGGRRHPSSYRPPTPGVTGGSFVGTDYDRPLVIVSTRKLRACR